MRRVRPRRGDRGGTHVRVVARRDERRLGMGKETRGDAEIVRTEAIGQEFGQNANPSPEDELERRSRIELGEELATMTTRCRARGNGDHARFAGAKGSVHGRLLRVHRARKRLTEDLQVGTQVDPPRTTAHGRTHRKAGDGCVGEAARLRERLDQVFVFQGVQAAILTRVPWRVRHCAHDAKDSA